MYGSATGACNVIVPLGTRFGLLSREGFIEAMADRTDNAPSSEELLSLTSEIVAAHVSNNTVAVGDLPGLIEQVYKTLSSVGGGGEPAADKPTPAVPIKKSVTPDFIVCLEDGKKLKMLKRHLKTAYDLTPEEYRARWGLPWDYPMVAPAYARKRQALAKQIGLGRKPRGAKK